MIRVYIACLWMVFSVYYSWRLRPTPRFPWPETLALTTPEVVRVPGDADADMIQRVIDSGVPVVHFLPRTYVVDRTIELGNPYINGRKFYGMDLRGGPHLKADDQTLSLREAK